MQILIIPGKLLTIACFFICYFALPLFQMILFIIESYSILLSYVPHLKHYYSEE